MEWWSERGYFYENAEADRGSVERGRLWKNRVELALKDEAILLVDPAPGVTVLEIGCGNGANLVYCGLQGASVIGVDLNEPGIAVANEKLAHLGIDGKAHVGDACQVPVADGEVDAVLSSDLHEHLTESIQLAVLREAWRALRPGGRLAVKTPNLTYLRLGVWFKRGRAILAGQDPRGICIPHTPGTVEPDHVGLVSRVTLAAQLAEAGFTHVNWVYPPVRQLGPLGAFASEIPGVRDALCETLLVVARKPIAAAHFPD